MRKKLCSLFILMVLAIPSFAQNRKKDSLVERLNAAKEDTTRVKILVKLSQVVFATQRDEAKNYAEQAQYLAKKNRPQKGRGACLQDTGYH